MRYWWVNQKKTHRHEISGGYLWSPKTKSTGARNPFYDFMTEVMPGDIVFSYYNQAIRAVGKALGQAQTASKPDFGLAGANWANEGWYIEVEFETLETPLLPKEHMDVLRPLLPDTYAPLKQTGDGKEFYLTELSDQFGSSLIALIGDAGSSAVSRLSHYRPIENPANDANQAAIAGRTDIGETTKTQLVKARRGQGHFRANVRLNESRCRVTGVSDPTCLIASHIKPWSESNDEEKLHGCNGLLLAPHIDHLFDKGLISFSDDGALLISPDLDVSILQAWAINRTQNVGKFNKDQAIFLKYHRMRHGFE